MGILLLCLAILSLPLLGWLIASACEGKWLPISNIWTPIKPKEVEEPPVGNLIEAAIAAAHKQAEKEVLDAIEVTRQAIKLKLGKSVARKIEVIENQVFVEGVRFTATENKCYYSGSVSYYVYAHIVSDRGYEETRNIGSLADLGSIFLEKHKDVVK